MIRDFLRNIIESSNQCENPINLHIVTSVVPQRTNRLLLNSDMMLYDLSVRAAHVRDDDGK